MKQTSAEKLSYSAATEELEGIVRAIEGGEVDVDLLAAKVKRAAALINACKVKLRSASDDVEVALASLDTGSIPPAPVDGGRDGPI